MLIGKRNMGILRIGGIVLALITFIILIIRIQARRKKGKEEKFQAIKKMRESSLKEALSNTLEGNIEASSVTPYRPYKVEYSTGENQDSKEKRPLLQIIERNKLAEKKYIFRSNETIILGVQFGTATILNNLENAQAWCELFFQNGVYCVRSYGKGEIYVQRGHKTAIVDKMGIKLKSKDIIQLHETTFQIFYIKG